MFKKIRAVVKNHVQRNHEFYKTCVIAGSLLIVLNVSLYLSVFAPAFISGFVDGIKNGASLA